MSRVICLKFSVLLGLTLCGLVSCGERPARPSQTKIIGGTPVVGSDFRNVVAIMRDQLTICSGTLIAPDLILTAAHCFEKLQHSTLSTLGLYRVVTKNSGDSVSDERTANITDVGIHPRFWKDHRGAMDFAWVRFDPPFDIAPAEMPVTHTELDPLLRASTSTVIVGYGLSTMRLPDEGEPPPIGIKRQAVSPINYRTGVEMFAGSHDFDSCTGDSGGPAFLKTEGTDSVPSHFVLAGVTSRGPMPCASDRESGAYGLVTEAVCWLRSSANFRSNDPVVQDFCVREAAQGSGEVDPSERSVVMTKDFSVACQDEALTEAERHDLRELFIVAKIEPKRDITSCEALSVFVKSAVDLDLSSRHMRQLSWLGEAQKLKTLDVSDNLLLSIEPISRLIHLTQVDVRNNSIFDLTALKHMSETITVHGLHTQASNLSETTYREIAEHGAGVPSDVRSLTIVLRDRLVAGNIERKSRDLALTRQLDLSSRGLRSLLAIHGLENLESLSISNNPDIKDWDELLSLDRLRILRYSSSNQIPAGLLLQLHKRGVELALDL
jgi:Leucine-rich repeat (LRR) protein